MPNNLFKPLFLSTLLSATSVCHAQFVDDFDGGSAKGWQLLTGDGAATIKMVPEDGVARVRIDATQDRDNVWWTVIKRDIAQSLDLEKLQGPDYELRVEARVRPSDAPRRVNFMINTQRTTDFHKQLREYDLDRTDQWHVISMTTRDFDVQPGDQINVQLGITDWGPGEYYLDLDYYRAEVVKVADAEPDLGEPLVYHPPVPALDAFAHHLKVSQDAVINAQYPEVNFHNWQSNGERALTVSAGQFPILRWDLQEYRNRKAEGAGVLTLTTQSIQSGGNYVGAYGEDFGIEFGKIRVFEILGGDPQWQQSNVTFASFTQGHDLEAVLNSQMVFDTEVADVGAKTTITIPRPVLQRMLDGTTRGLLLRPLGALDVSVYDSEQGDGSQGPSLHFNTRSK